MKNTISWICFLAAAHLLIFWVICGLQTLHTVGPAGTIEMYPDAPTFWNALTGNHSWVHGLLLILDLTVLGFVLRKEE